MVRAAARALGITAALAVAVLWAFLTWRGLTLECPEWDEEEHDEPTIARASRPGSPLPPSAG